MVRLVTAIALALMLAALAGCAEEPAQSEKPSAKPSARQEQKPLVMKLHIATSGGAGYGGNYSDSGGSNSLESAYRDTTKTLKVKPGDTVIATVARLTDSGEVTVTLSYKGRTLFEDTAGNEDDTVNLVYDTHDL